MVVRVLRIIVLAAACLALQACHRVPPQVQAAADAQKLLAAVWSGDAQAFEAHVDRPALRADLRRQLAELAQANTLSVEGGASDAALDRMITPSALRLSDSSGQPLARAPSEAQVQLMMALVGETRACLRDGSAPAGCVLTFDRDDHGWRLVGMAPAGVVIAVPPEPAQSG
jgi:hypothetical protein